MSYTIIKIGVWAIWPALLAALILAAIVAVLLERRVMQKRAARGLRIQGKTGLAYQEFVEIGGIPQWICVRGEDRQNPALLIVHGGPGASCSIFTPRIRSWERHFTVVQWDQRGSGKTLGRTGRKGTGDLNAEIVIRDGIELAEFLRRRLEKDKLALLACSLGSTFGLEMVQRRPELFAAYIGTDQNVGMIRFHAENFRATIERLRALGLTRRATALCRIGADPARWTAADFETVARWTMKSDPETNALIMKLLKSSIWHSPAHTLWDIATFVRGMNFSREQLMPDVRIYDAWRRGTRFELPFFIFQGERDVLTPYGAARAFFEDVVAPVKHMVSISGVGHFAAFLEPEQFLQALMKHVLPLLECT